MKKTIIIAAVLAAMLTLASCGNVKETTPAEPGAPAVNTADTNDTVDTVTDSADPEDSAPEDSSIDEQKSTSEAAAESRTEVSAADSTAPKADNTKAEKSNDTNTTNSTNNTNSTDSTAAAPAQQAPAADTSATAQDSQSVDMDDLRLQLNGSIEMLNTQVSIVKGALADNSVWYDADFNITNDRDQAAYYPIPEEYREQCLAFDMVMYSGHFTGSFISSMGLDVSDKIVEHDGSLYFKADKYTAHRPTYYVLLNDEVRMDGTDRFHVEVTDGQGIYDLTFVYETCITVYDYLWKMDSMTYERSYN